MNKISNKNNVKMMVKNGVGVKDLPKLTKNFMSVRAPEIAIGTGVVALVVAVGLGIRATVKAVRIADQDTKDRQARADDGENVSVSRTKTETVKLVWKCYIPCGVAAVTGIAATVVGVKKELGRSAALAAGLTMAEEMSQKYKQVVEESVPEKKKEEIKKKFADEVAQDGLDKMEYENIRVTGSGDALFMFPLIGLVVRSSMAEIYRSLNEVNKRLGYGEDITLDEYFDELGVDYIPKLAEYCTLFASNGMLELDTTQAMVMYHGEPCTIVEMTQQNGDIVSRGSYMVAVENPRRYY